MKKICKAIFWLIIAMSIPTLICIIVLYANDKQLLAPFVNWVKEPANLTAFIISIGAYFPIVNGIWKFVMNIITSHIAFKNIKRSKIDKIKIYDDDKNNYIYYDEKNNIIDLQFKSPNDVPPDKLIEMMIAELKNRITDYNNK